MKDRYSVYENDVMYEPLSGEYSFSDFADDIMQNISRIQLKDKRIWCLAVKQFSDSTESFGVDNKDKGWRCEYWGKLMRGACFVCRVSQDVELYSLLEETVCDMLKAQDSLGRFSTYTPDFEFNGWDIWGRKYIMLGMIYFLDICRSEELRERIISALIRHADYMTERLGNGNDGKLNIAKCTSHWDGLNSCSILEPFVFLYNLTGKKSYLDFADMLVGIGGTASTNLFELCYNNNTEINDFPQRKAYEMMSCFEGLAEYIRIKPNERYRAALKNFADRILDEELSVIGCCGCDFECFDSTRSSQFAPESRNNVMQETCVTVTFMKFCWQILRMYGDPRFADALERSLYNAFCGAYLYEHEYDENDNCKIKIPIDSYSPLMLSTRKRKMGGRKTITEDGGIYGCCVAIYAAGFGASSFGAVAPSADGAYLNLYRRGRVTLPIMGKRVSFSVDTDYPYDKRIKVTLSLDSPYTFALYMRIPESARAASVRVNGAEYSAKNGGYTKIDREWSDGDTIELDLELLPTMIRPKDIVPNTSVSDFASFSYGPIVLAYDERLKYPTESLSLSKSEAENAKRLSREEAEIDCKLAYRFTDNSGQSFTLIDYASAGHGKEKTNVAAWISTAK